MTRTALMTDCDTAPPATLLVLYVLAESPDTPLSQAALRDEIESATGYAVEPSTLHRAIERLEAVGRIHRTETPAGDPAAVYDLHYANSMGIDIGENP